MKPLENLTNVEKAKLLHALFPGEIPAFLEYVTSRCKYIVEEQEEIRPTWKHQFLAFGFWISLAEDAEKTIKQSGAKLEKRSSLFADKLFYGHAAFYLADCLCQYAGRENLNNQKFCKAVNLFFMS